MKLTKDLKIISDHYINLVNEDPCIFLMPNDMISACRVFLQKLSAEEIINALDIANNRKDFSSPSFFSAKKYFYGVCWKMIKDEK